MTGARGRDADPQQFLIAFGRAVRREREARGWTQAVLAERAGMRIDYLREIEHGRANPQYMRLDQLVRRGLGMSLEEVAVRADREAAQGE